MATSRVAPVVPYRFLGLRILGVVILCILSLGVASPWLYLLLLRGPLQGQGWMGRADAACSGVAPVVPSGFLGLRIHGDGILHVLSRGVAPPSLCVLLLRGPLCIGYSLNEFS